MTRILFLIAMLLLAYGLVYAAKTIFGWKLSQQGIVVISSLLWAVLVVVGFFFYLWLQTL